MNFRVDLILETEQRSASKVSLKGIIMITAMVVILLLMLGIGTLAFSTIQLNGQLASLKENWTTNEKNQKKALAVRAELTANKAILDEVKGWESASVKWDDFLKELQKLVPARKVQFDNMEIAHSLQPVEGSAARVYSLTLRGKAAKAAESRNANFDDFVAALKNSAVLTNSLVDIKATLLADESGTEESQDAAGAVAKNALLFRVECPFKPRKFK